MTKIVIKSSQDVFAALSEIRQAKGTLRPEDVVDAARSDARISNYFEWDDENAAHEYRIGQARELIRSVRCQVENKSLGLVTPYYVRDPDAAPGVQGYASIPELLDDAERARRSIISEFKAAAAALERARSIESALQLGEQIGEILSSVENLRNAISASSARQ